MRARLSCALNQNGPEARKPAGAPSPARISCHRTRAEKFTCGRRLAIQSRCSSCRLLVAASWYGSQDDCRRQSCTVLLSRSIAADQAPEPHVRQATGARRRRETRGPRALCLATLVRHRYRQIFLFHRSLLGGDGWKFRRPMTWSPPDIDYLELNVNTPIRGITSCVSNVEDDAGAPRF